MTLRLQEQLHSVHRKDHPMGLPSCSVVLQMSGLPEWLVLMPMVVNRHCQKAEYLTAAVCRRCQRGLILLLHWKEDYPQESSRDYQSRSQMSSSGRASLHSTEQPRPAGWRSQAYLPLRTAYCQIAKTLHWAQHQSLRSY